MKSTISIPPKVLYGQVSSFSGRGAGPYPSSDDFWIGGSTPRDYQWEINIAVVTQQHSSYSTRKPYFYNGMDVKVGDYVADVQKGICLKIISITSKTDADVVCVVEDELRYNTFKSDANGVGIFAVPSYVIIFSTNEDNNPIVDPLPSQGVDASFYPNLLSRFDNFEQNRHFSLHKEAHGFEVGDLISADSQNNTFVKTDEAHPYIIGQVSYVDLGPDDFMFDPLEKTVGIMDSLIGEVGQILYADASSAGDLATAGTIPIMIKLRDFTSTETIGTVESPTITVGNVFRLNGYEITTSDVTLLSVISDINNTTNIHSITASLVAAATVAETNLADCVLGEPALYIAGEVNPSVTINDVLVTFVTTTTGQASYGDVYALEEDMAFDINAANIPDIIATAAGNKLIITNTAGGDIIIVNGNPDTNGNYFAGVSSGSGIAGSVSGSDTGGHIKLTAPDARAIEIYDVSGSCASDMGVVSAENGTKAAALYIDQGVRSASGYVVETIEARDAIAAGFGDTCYVTDKGNGEWGYYLYTLAGEWVKISDQDSSITDAQSVEVDITNTSDSSGLIYTISNGSRVSFVNVKVTEAFDPASTLSIGDDGDNSRLMTVSLNDLSVVSDYSYNPSYFYNDGSDAEIKFYFTANGSATGKATISIVYS